MVEETVPTDILPAAVIVPVPDTENWVLELTWKLMKSPLNPAAGFEPMNVPVVFDSWMVFGPIWTSCELVDAGGAPETMRALSPVRDDWRYPVARIFVEDTDASDDWPEAKRFAAWR